MLYTDFFASQNKEAKSSPHQKSKFYFVKLDFASQNKEDIWIF